MDLTPEATLVALCFAEHTVPKKSAPRGDTCSLTLQEVRAHTRLGIKGARKGKQELVERGWLVEVVKPHQHFPGVYRLAIPWPHRQIPSSECPLSRPTPWGTSDDSRHTPGRAQAYPGGDPDLPPGVPTNTRTQGTQRRAPVRCVHGRPIRAPGDCPDCDQESEGTNG